MIKKIFQNLLSIGIYSDTSDKDIKKIRLLNGFAMCWVCFSILFVTADVSFLADPTNNVASHGVNLILLFFIFVFQKKRYYLQARLLYIFSSLFTYFMFANFLEPNKFMEFYFLIVPMISLLLIESFKINLTVLIISFLCFYLPIVLYNHYSVYEKNPLTIFIVFFSGFFILNYFKKLNAQKEALLEAQKQELENLNSFKDRFFINIAHELRTPLTLIGGMASQSIKESFQTDFSDKILEQSNKMKQIVDDILDLSKINSQGISLSPRTINVNSFLVRIHQLFLPVFEQKGIELDLKLTPETCQVGVDLIYFERAVNNVLLNSLKFTEKGSVSVTSKNVGNKTEISISDSGIGMDENELDKIFTEFYQVDNHINKASGSGIGLSFATKIVELHSGELKVSSELNKGTTFTFSLDRDHSSLEENICVDSIETKKEVLLNNAQELKNKKILLVEDHPEMRAYLSGILSNYEVLEAKNGVEALNIIGKETIDFILTDYMMPKMNGYDFIKKVKENKCDVPVLMLTARADVEAKLEVLRLGIDDYMTKPFHADELLIRIENGLTNNKERKDFIKVEKIEEDLSRDSLIESLKEFISSNCCKNEFSLEDVKEEFALSTSSLYRKVKSKTGMSPNELVREVRMQKARGILESGEVISLKALAMSVGVKNTTYFSKHYKERFGVELGKLLSKKEA